MFIRSALPGDVSSSKALHVDSLSIHFAIIISLLLYLLSSNTLNAWGKYITQLRHLCKRLIRDEPLNRKR